MSATKRWVIAGAVVGLAIPFAFRVYESLQFGLVRPAVLYLFWPAELVSAFEYRTGLAMLANMLAFGTIAGLLRRGFLIVLGALLILAWAFSPPSNGALNRRFNQQLSSLQHLSEMSQSESGILSISSDSLVTVDRRTYSVADPQRLLTPQRWGEYRNILTALHMREVLFSPTGSGEVYVEAQTLGSGLLRSYYGYLYCPAMSAKPRVYPPCLDGRDSECKTFYTYKALGSNWYVYTVFQSRYIE